MITTLCITLSILFVDKVVQLYTSERTISEMNQFIENQHWREDQLRAHCNLQYFKMKARPTFYDTFKETVHELQYLLQKHVPLKSVSDAFSYKSLYLMDTLVTHSLHELLEMSYVAENESYNISLNNNTYYLLKSGIKHIEQPQWLYNMGSYTLTVSDMKQI
jgi:hypothetical protein